MSEFQENIELETEVTETKETEELESTVFSNPVAHKGKKKKSSTKSFVIKIASAFLAVAILAGGTIAVIKLIPEKQVESGEEIKKSISVLSNLSKAVQEVNVTNKNGNFKLYPTKEVINDKNTTVWHLDGIDASLTDSSTISSIANNAISLSASREVDLKDRKLSDFGLDEPVATAEVKFSDGTKGYSVMIGKTSPDNTGTYIKVSDRDKAYVVDSQITDAFTFEAIDLGNADPFPPAEYEVDVSSYVNDSGVITSFDTMTLSGKKYPQKLTITPNEEDLKIAIVSYITTTPHRRYADKVDVLLSPFSNGVTASGSYSFDMSQESLKKFGLDNPDVVIAMTIGKETKTFKISIVDDNFCAVINEDSKQIKKVSRSILSFVDAKIENFYNKWIFMESIRDLSNFNVTTEGKTYNFDIQYNPDDEEKEFVITHDGKTLTSSNFQDFYGEFSIIKCADFEVSQPQGAPAATIKITFSMDGKQVKIDYYKVSETKYMCYRDGMPMGRISSLTYNKLIKNLKAVSQDKEIT